MRTVTPKLRAVGCVLTAIGLCLAAEAAPGKSPLENLPPHIRRITHFGQRADWSHDAKRLLFLERTFGDVYEVELSTGIIRPLTHHFFHEGFTRALYLANGDVLLSGARKFDATDPWPSRNEKNAELWVLSKNLRSPPVPLGVHCSEGPAVSRRRNHIAWTEGGGFWKADVTYEGGSPRLKNKRRILEKKDVPFQCGLETQNFRPPQEAELIFSAYWHQGTDVCGLKIANGTITNYSAFRNDYQTCIPVTLIIPSCESECCGISG